MGAKDWKTASAATLDTRSPRQDSVFLTTGELMRTIATSAGLVRSPATFAGPKDFFLEKMCKLIFSSEAATRRSRFQGKEAMNS
ncbi:MAG: hypothetical protein DMG51_13430 [Acidobacteria bacterium]|nr:MAG: hypothetical protein DMG51_13430 [Acidobacteriota bacterium]